MHVATYIEQLSERDPRRRRSCAWAAQRHLFDWMAIGQIMPTPLAAAVRGLRHVAGCGKTPVLDPAEARQLHPGIDGLDEGRF